MEALKRPVTSDTAAAATSAQAASAPRVLLIMHRAAQARKKQGQNAREGFSPSSARSARSSTPHRPSSAVPMPLVLVKRWKGCSLKRLFIKNTAPAARAASQSPAPRRFASAHSAASVKRPTGAYQ